MGHGGRLACVCAAALVACGDNRGTTTGDGTRLHLSWLEFEDGTRQVVDDNLWDVQRDEVCSPQRWTDGNTFCTPTEISGLYAHYTDANCAIAEYLAESPDEPAYVARYEQVGDEQRVASLARPEPATLAMYWELDGETCNGPYASVGRPFYRAGAEVSRSGLVRLRALESTGNGRVGVRATTSDDGLYLPSDFVDRNLHAPCTLNPSSATAAFCIPEGTGEVQYRDAACTKAVLSLGSADGEPPPAVVAGSTCVPQVYAVGAATSEAPAYVQMSGDCVESTQVGALWFTLIEHPVAQVPRVREVVAGRRLETIVMNVDGVRVAARQLYDSEVGEECTRATSPREPGVYRCVPRDVGFVVHGFSDAVCTIPIDVAVVYGAEGRATCTGVGPPRFARDFSGSTIIRELGALRASVYFRSGTACERDVSTYYQYHDVGAPVPDAMWARATIVRD